eukprot:SAG31_NODE_26335_length_444_cov_0.742029_1_plen_29_part_10
MQSAAYWAGGAQKWDSCESAMEDRPVLHG